MPARYVLGVGRTESLTAAGAWAEAHAASSGVPLVRVRVASSDDEGHARREEESGVDRLLPPGPVAEALARFLRVDDLLVIGTGKTGFIRSRVFGSLSLQIVAEAPCAVAVVPQTDVRFRTGVVAGVKDDDLLPVIVRAAAEEAHERREALQLIHSSFEGVVPAPVETSGPVLVRAASLVATRDPDTKVRTRITGRSPAEALLDASRNASLLVVGTGHPRGSGHAIGPVTHDVLVNINAPVLVVRPPLTDTTDS